MLLGDVFTTFDTQDSGNVSYGVRIGERRFFVKTAGRVDDPQHAARVAWLRNAVVIAGCSSHRALSALDHVIESPSGPLLVYDWFDGELLGVPSTRRDDPTSSFARFRALPVGGHLISRKSGPGALTENWPAAVTSATMIAA